MLKIEYSFFNLGLLLSETLWYTLGYSNLFFSIFSHARHAGNKLIRGDDDLYILQVAHEIDGIVLSNDQYRQYWDTQPMYREIIEKRLIQPLFVHNKLILPPDPLGKSGPKLEQFLRFDKD